MPELPEVECVRRSLQAALIGRRIDDARVIRRDVITAPGDPTGGFSRARSSARGSLLAPVPLSPANLLVGSTVERVDRHGKQLAIRGVNPSGHRSAVLVQLGMTGQLLLSDDRPCERSHVHVVWTLSKPGKRTPGFLSFRDPRRFGGVRIALSDAAVEEAWAMLGPDALTISAEQLASRLAGSSRAIKAALLDQAVLAGVGNIYADEAMWEARIAPRCSTARLKVEQVEHLCNAVRSVLASAVGAGGSTLRDYVDGNGREGTFQTQHRVYGRAGEPCLRCGRALSSAVIAQRTTVWCRTCQK